MGRGKIEIKMIENRTNRQVTYSKRRNGIFKKAQELTVLCDAKVSFIMFSTSRKLHEYTSPNITTKEIYDRYQKALGIDLWSSHYEKMLEQLKNLKDINNRLSREIRHRLGQDLNGLNLVELHALEHKVSTSVDVIRARKLHVIKGQTDKYKKKINNLDKIQQDLQLNLVRLAGENEAKCEESQYGLVLVDNEAADYGSAVAMANGASNLFAFRLQNLNLHDAGGFGSQDLRLA